MMGAIDTRNMQSNFAVNKYLHTVASCWILLIYMRELASQALCFMQPHLHCTIWCINTNHIKEQLDSCQIMAALWLKSLGPWTYFASIIIQISKRLWLILTKCTIIVPSCDWQMKNRKQIMEGMLMFARYSLLLGGREGGFVQTWTVLIILFNFPNTSDVSSTDLSYLLFKQM